MSSEIIAIDNLAEVASCELLPEAAIIVYNSDDEYYLEMHDIENGKLKEGHPLSRKAISAIAANFSQEHIILPQGQIPGNMLYCDMRIGYQKYIWYVPPQKHQMYFRDDLNIRDGEYYMPGIVFNAQGNELNVYAYKGKKPKELYHAPFFNVDSTGRVCLGSSAVKQPQKPSFSDIIKYYEDRFWFSRFTHLGGSGNPTKNNLVHVIKKSTESFDLDELVPMNRNLKDILK